jgi:hypothetical protein
MTKDYEYDISDDNSVHSFGMAQGEALVESWRDEANPEQGDPTWPVTYGYEYDDHGVPLGEQFFVRVPPDILKDDNMLEAYVSGVAIIITGARGSDSPDNPEHPYDDPDDEEVEEEEDEEG